MPACPCCRAAIPPVRLLLASNPFGLTCPTCRADLRIAGPALQTFVACALAALVLGGWLGTAWARNPFELPLARVGAISLAFVALCGAASTFALRGEGCLVRRRA